MKFEFIGDYPEPVNGYNGDKISTGDVVELNEHFSGKAARNPEYREVKPGPKPKKAADGNQGGS